MFICVHLRPFSVICFLIPISYFLSQILWARILYVYFFSRGYPMASL